MFPPRSASRFLAKLPRLQARNWAWFTLAALTGIAGWSASGSGVKDAILELDVVQPVFSVLPIEIDAIQKIIPLGNLNPRGGHTLPTDHIYFDYGDNTNLEVRAPGPGSVFALRPQSKEDLKVEIRVNSNLSYYLTHIIPDPGIVVGASIRVGQVLGHPSGRSMLDLGAYDTRVRLKGLVNPDRYPPPTLQTVPPLALFVEPLKSRLYTKVTRDGPDKDGRIDYDQPGAVCGNWFLAEPEPSMKSGGRQEFGANELAFAYDVQHPSLPRVSIGGTVAPAGVYGLAPESPDPRRVTMETGIVVFRLTGPFDRPSNAPPGANPPASPGILLVQVLNDRELKVEWFEKRDSFPNPAFTSKALIYRR